jgi:hypothetical protein
VFSIGYGILVRRLKLELVWLWEVKLGKVAEKGERGREIAENVG